MIRLLDGEPLVYDGVLWIVKGYQHPSGYVIAYPRYDLFNYEKLSHSRREALISTHLVWWDCIKQYIPVIDVNRVYTYDKCYSKYSCILLRILEEYLDDTSIGVTGSSLIGEGNDIDIVIYGYKPWIIDVLRELRARNILRRPGIGVLFREYLLKHKGVISFTSYLYLKKNSLLQGVFMDKPYSIRINLYDHGFGKCIDRVYSREEYYGRIRVREVISKYTTPSRYIVRDSNGSTYILETYRIIYSELCEGDEYFVKGFLEERSDGYYIIPDHGFLEPIY